MSLRNCTKLSLLKYINWCCPENLYHFKSFLHKFWSAPMGTLGIVHSVLPLCSFYLYRLSVHFICTASLFILSVILLPLCSFYLYCLSVHYICTTSLFIYLYCLSVHFICTASLFILFVLPLCSFYLYCLSVHFICTASLFILSVLSLCSFLSVLSLCSFYHTQDSNEFTGCINHDMSDDNHSTYNSIFVTYERLFVSIPQIE